MPFIFLDMELCKYSAKASTFKGLKYKAALNIKYEILKNIIKKL